MFYSLFGARYLFGLLALFSLGVCSVNASTQWRMWQQFKDDYISEDGRVIDSASPNRITTSEGQSYALFFALVADDHFMFDKLLHWTEEHLAEGDLGQHLPAWKWGLNQKKEGVVLDSNSASDSDLWIAYDLLEAGRLWKRGDYTSLGTQLLERITQEEVVNVAGLGPMLLPGKYGFNFPDSWRLNPSYLPPPILPKLAASNSKWKVIERNMERLLLETSPKGFAPDWVIWKKGRGWLSDTENPNLGSYNAIRVYLWIGMMADHAKYRTALTQHFLPILSLTQKSGVPPEQINIVTGKIQGTGSLGFSAALLPLLLNNPNALLVQRQRVDALPLAKDSYYASVLRLFGQGWDQHYYRFNVAGELIRLK